MPIYQYQCEFGHLHEEFQSIKEFDKNRQVECPECGNIMESYIGEPPFGFARQEATTIGQLGERNFKALGKVKGQEMMEQQKEKKIEAEKELLRQKGLDGDKLPEYKKMRKLANLTPAQKEKYVMTGKLPPG